MICWEVGCISVPVSNALIEHDSVFVVFAVITLGDAHLYSFISSTAVKHVTWVFRNSCRLNWNAKNASTVQSSLSVGLGVKLELSHFKINIRCSHVLKYEMIQMQLLLDLGLRLQLMIIFNYWLGLGNILVLISWYETRYRLRFRIS